ncbi:FdhF/YdeP family oxidoreductase [Pararhizobium mangrovi]|uniref:FdhF/YdeP family oxidoreductase n=1 Tax=Pararhizobium mangrovi TaxID=2590452 RepID=A0A506U933_9HYPH|nr:FdhF/YdeP family oxidoreductase [Pararhizobium mangrovi]TPW29866.1 FdhF/YdeP family oxidoreductase [Pararhizobium mangrovi]
MKRAELDEGSIRIEPYKHPTGGWGSLRSIIGKAEAEGMIRSTVWNQLRRQNKPEGVMCVSCSWAKPKKPHEFEFCENGAKATLWEQTRHRCDAGFFVEHTVTELLEWNDYDLERTGRLTEPMKYNPASDHYEPISWSQAFREIGETLNTLEPTSVIFYASGRASLETSHMYQLLARIYGSQNLPDSSNMCHESTSVGLPKSIGSPVGTVQLEDFEETDMIFFIGHNVGTNAPRMLHPLQAARKRGVPLVTFNPLKERGLMRFKSPQNPMEMLSPGEGTEMSSDYYQVRSGGDLAALTGIAKHVLEMDDKASAEGGRRVIDYAFVEEHTSGFEAFCAYLRETGWEEIEKQSGLHRDDLVHVAKLYASKERVIANYGMGITQHRRGVATVQMLCNLLLMRGNIGKTGAGISPVRGHSNVQGQRTVGISEKPELVPLDKLKELYEFEPPREKGRDTVESCEGIIDGSVKAFIGLGGNFSRAVPETERVETAWRELDLHVQIATKLNRNHLLASKATYLLPCLGRMDRDTQESGDQWVSIEDSTANIHGSFGSHPPVSDMLLSEPKIVAEIAKATVGGKAKVPWDEWVGDYAKVRDAIERAYPRDFAQFNERFRKAGGFHRDIAACRREWRTENGKANFIAPGGLDADPNVNTDRKNVFTLITLRSNDQFNTTVYGYNDRLRGINGTRMIVMMNTGDMARMGVSAGDEVDLHAAADDGIERKPVERLRVVPYALPAGDCAGYFPELNSLIALSHHALESHVPAGKSVPVKIVKSASA